MNLPGSIQQNRIFHFPYSVQTANGRPIKASPSLHLKLIPVPRFLYDPNVSVQTASCTSGRDLSQSANSRT